jgi:hypothetical protein
MSLNIIWRFAPDQEACDWTDPLGDIEIIDDRGVVAGESGTNVDTYFFALLEVVKSLGATGRASVDVIVEPYFFNAVSIGEGFELEYRGAKLKISSLDEFSRVLARETHALLDIILPLQPADVNPSSQHAELAAFADVFDPR